MATLPELCNQGKLVRLDPQLDDWENELRVIYMSPKMDEWLQKKLPTLESIFDQDHSPEEQMDALVHAYATGEALNIGTQFHIMKPHEKGFWELKTLDLRIFGWFARRDHFVATGADMKANLLKYEGMATGYMNEGGYIRSKLDLDEPKFIAGTETNAVISNCSYTV